MTKKRYTGRCFIAIFLLCCSSTIMAAGTLSDTPYTKERAVYQQALKDLKQSPTFSVKQYQDIHQQLSNYPLQAYWDYAYLKTQFKTLPTEKVQAFLNNNEGSHIAYLMQAYWLSYLARNKQWNLYQQFYQPSSNKSQQCSSLTAELALGGDKKSIYAKTSDIWLSGSSLPDRCNTLFNRWQQAGFLTTDIAWQRFEMAYAANNLKLAKYLSNKLTPKHKTLAIQLLSPQRYADTWFIRLNSPLPKQALHSATLKRLLRKLADTHHQQVSQLIEFHPLGMTEEDAVEVKKLCAWYYAKHDATKAQSWLKQVNGKAKNKALQAFELRYALQAKNWRRYKQAYLQASKDTQQLAEWRYWFAVAQQESGRLSLNPERHPDLIFHELAQERHFYGFLASDKIKNSPAYTINIATTFIAAPLDENIEQQLAASFELFHIQESRSANLAWYFSTRVFNQQQWQQAAVLANNNHWHARSIQAHAKAKLWDNVEARFPLAFAEEFKKQSSTQGINASWLFAMARQESAFSPQATSHVGAKGVLQLMPKTARKVAKSLNIDFQTSKLEDPAYNIKLGSKYLKDMLTRFNNNYILATAAYNAGPHRVDEWLSLRPLTLDWVHWVATIPYKETRQYVQNILTYSIIYQSRLDKDKPLLLSDFAPQLNKSI